MHRLLLSSHSFFLDEFYHIWHLDNFLPQLIWWESNQQTKIIHRYFYAGKQKNSRQSRMRARWLKFVFPQYLASWAPQGIKSNFLERLEALTSTSSQPWPVDQCLLTTSRIYCVEHLALRHPWLLFVCWPRSLCLALSFCLHFDIFSIDFFNF